MSKLTDLRVAVAEALGAAAQLEGLARIPSQPRANQLWVVPDPDRRYIDAKASGATFRTPAVHLAAVATTTMIPFDAAQEWCDELLCRLFVASRVDIRMRAIAGGLMIESSSAPGPLDVNSQLVAVELTLSPLIVSLED